MTTTTRITLRSQNIGYGWTIKAVRGADGRSVIADVTKPCITGRVRDVKAERENRIRATSGGLYFREALFVNGCRVLSDDVADVLLDLDLDGYATVTIADAPPAPSPFAFEVRDFSDAAVYPEGRTVSKHRTEAAAERKIARDLRAVRARQGARAFLNYRTVEL